MSFANVGSADRIFRIILGLILAAIPFLLESVAPSSAIGIACFAGAAIMIVTAAVKFCPIYGVFGLRTRPKD
ncbi:MAG: DUF2892 domain-containing protein [Pseudomonadota bacterium]